MSLEKNLWNPFSYSTTRTDSVEKITFNDRHILDLCWIGLVKNLNIDPGGRLIRVTRKALESIFQNLPQISRLFTKFILNILYYKFIEKSRKKLWKHVFFTFCDTENPKGKTNPTVYLTQSVVEFYLFSWHLNLETLSMPQGRGSLGLGKSFCAISMVIFRNVSISPIFSLVTTNMMDIKIPQSIFL